MSILKNNSDYTLTVLADLEIKQKLFLEEEYETARELYQKRLWNKINGRILIYPFDEDNLGGLGYDLTIGDEALSTRDQHKINIKEEKEINIQPGETMLILTSEYIALPKNISGLIEMKARHVFEGVIASATKIDPTWYGKLIIAIANHSKNILKFRYKEKFSTMILMYLNTDCKKILTKDTTPFLGQESIIYIPQNIIPWIPRRPEAITEEDIRMVVERFGAPFDVIEGMFNLHYKKTKDFIEKEWGPHVLREMEHVATSRAYSYLRWFTGAVIVAIFILVIGFVIKMFS